ncbi:uncharacterized protein ISCGN_015926 [Ixodes scapularis]
MGCNPGKFMRNKVHAISAAAGVSKAAAAEGGLVIVNKQGSPQRCSSPNSRNYPHPIITLTGSGPNSMMSRLSRPMPGTPIRVTRERSSSQVEFFRVLDEKINKGRDNVSEDGLSRCSVMSL